MTASKGLNKGFGASGNQKFHRALSKTLVPLVPALKHLFDRGTLNRVSLLVLMIDQATFHSATVVTINSPFAARTTPFSLGPTAKRAPPCGSY